MPQVRPGRLARRERPARLVQQDQARPVQLGRKAHWAPPAQHRRHPVPLPATSLAHIRGRRWSRPPSRGQLHQHDLTVDTKGASQRQWHGGSGGIPRAPLGGYRMRVRAAPRRRTALPTALPPSGAATGDRHVSGPTLVTTAVAAVVTTCSPSIEGRLTAAGNGAAPPAQIPSRRRSWMGRPPSAR